jgi:hypothetical protein
MIYDSSQNYFEWRHSPFKLTLFNYYKTEHISYWHYQFYVDNHMIEENRSYATSHINYPPGFYLSLLESIAYGLDEPLKLLDIINGLKVYQR